MSLIASINLIDRLILLEDGRELKITQFYSSGDPLSPLDHRSQLLKHHRIDSHEGAQVFVAEFPDTDGAYLIVDLQQLSFAKPSEIN